MTSRRCASGSVRAAEAARTERVRAFGTACVTRSAHRRPDASRSAHTVPLPVGGRGLGMGPTQRAPPRSSSRGPPGARARARRAAPGARAHGHPRPPRRDRAARRRADRRRRVRLGRPHERRTARASCAGGCAGHPGGWPRSGGRRPTRSAGPTWSPPTSTQEGLLAALPEPRRPRPVRGRGGCAAAAPGDPRRRRRRALSHRASSRPERGRTCDLVVLASPSAARAYGALVEAPPRRSRSGRRRRARRARPGVDGRRRGARRATSTVWSPRSERALGVAVDSAAMVICFLTDFGLQDDFVGTCHGVIARIAPEARVIDVTHGIPPTARAAGRARAREHPAVHAGRRPSRRRRPRRRRVAPSARPVATATGGSSSARTTVCCCRQRSGRGSLTCGSSRNPDVRARDDLADVPRPRPLRAGRRAPRERRAARRARAAARPEALVRLDLPEPRVRATSGSTRRCSTSTASATSP